MKIKWAVFFLVALCGFLLVLFFGIPTPNVLNHAYTGVVANIREHNGDLSVNNLELAPDAAEDVLRAIQSHSYARRFPNGSIISPGPARAAMLFLVYEEEGTQKHDLFLITNAGVISIDTFETSGSYFFLPRNAKAQKQLFETILDSIEK